LARINYQTETDFDDYKAWTSDIKGVEIRASKGIVKDEQSPKDTTAKAESRESSFEVYLEMFLSDPIISTAIDTTVDVVTRNGFRLVPKEGIEKSPEDIQKANAKLYDLLDLDQTLDPLLYSMLIYGGAFLEKRKSASKSINELFSLEATEMAIKYNKHGEILGFVQKSGKDDIPFEPTEVIYIPLRKIGSKVESYEPLEPVAEVFATSRYAHSYLRDVFLNLPPKYLYTLTGGSPEQRKKLISQIRIAKRDPTIDIVTQIQRDNALKVDTLQPNFDESLLKILEYVREQVLLVTRVPPVWVGLVNNDGANRGNSEAQIFSFETRIRKLQQKIESSFDKQLLPELGLKDFRFKFNTISLKNEKQIIENARQFRDMRLDPDSILEYLRSNGVNLRDGAEFEEAEEGLIKDNDLMQSRKREDRGTDDLNARLDSSGVSEDGEKKAQETKLS
jgi:hypothetical protein